MRCAGLRCVWHARCSRALRPDARALRRACRVVAPPSTLTPPHPHPPTLTPPMQERQVPVRRRLLHVPVPRGHAAPPGAPRWWPACWPAAGSRDEPPPAPAVTSPSRAPPAGHRRHRRRPTAVLVHPTLHYCTSAGRQPGAHQVCQHCQHGLRPVGERGHPVRGGHGGAPRL